MSTVEITPEEISRKSHGRSRVGNGAKLLPMTDGRSATARRFKDLIMDIADDLGGLNHVSEATRQLVRRASMLSAECERLEAMSVRGEAEFNVEVYVIMTNALRRVLMSIGLERRARDVNPPTLAQIAQDIAIERAPRCASADAEEASADG